MTLSDHTSDELHEIAATAYDSDDWPTFRQANSILHNRGDYATVEQVPIDGRCNAELER